MLFFVGCDGQSCDHLEGELATDSWFTMCAKQEQIFYTANPCRRANRKPALKRPGPSADSKRPNDYLRYRPSQVFSCFANHGIRFIQNSPVMVTFNLGRGQWPSRLIAI